MSTPTRTCTGCGRKAPKHELTRFVARNGTVTRDPTGRAPGRGAYTCPTSACFEQARARRGFTRTLRADLQVPRDVNPF